MVKLKSLKKQLRCRAVDWEQFCSRAKSVPDEVCVKRLRDVLKRDDPTVPIHVIQTLVDVYQPRGDSEMRSIVTLDVVRYACCFIPHMTVEIFSFLIDHVDHNAFQDSIEIVLNRDKLDGGWFKYGRYSLEALMELLKRSISKDILHRIHSIEFSSGFHALRNDDRFTITESILDKDPSMLMNVDSDGNIPLQHACERGNLENIMLLLRREEMFGAHVIGRGLYCKNNNDTIPLHHLVRKNSFDIINILICEDVLKRDDVVTYKMVHFALKCKRNSSIVRLLISKFPEVLSYYDEEGDLPLHIATQKHKHNRQTYGLNLIQMMICEGVTQEIGRCGGLCVRNSKETTPLQNILNFYDNGEVMSLMELLMDSNLISESDVLNQDLIMIALLRKNEDLVSSIVQRFPTSLHPTSSEANYPLYIACRERLSAELIQLMISKEMENCVDGSRGGLFSKKESGVRPIQLLASNPSDAILGLLRYLVESKPPLLKQKDVIDYNLDRSAICGKAESNFEYLYEQLSDDLRKLSLTSKDKDGRSNLHSAMTNRLSNRIIYKIVNENHRLLQMSGLYEKNNYGDMPIDVILRTHHPHWPESVALLADLSNSSMSFMTKEDVNNFHLLHKVARWPTSRLCRDKAHMFMKRFPEALFSKDDSGNLPIHNICHHQERWEDISQMLSFFVEYGMQVEAKGFRSLGGLLVENNDGISILKTIFQFEANRFHTTKDPRLFREMISGLLNLIMPHSTSIAPFIQFAMNNVPVEILPEIIDFWDDISSVTVRDQKGRLIIHIAAFKGLKWSGGMQKLVSVCHKSIGISDLETNCFPVLLAATGSNHDLDTIYELFCLNPLPLISALSMEKE